MVAGENEPLSQAKESRLIRERYRRRSEGDRSGKYHPLRADRLKSRHEKERRYRYILSRYLDGDAENWKMTEVGSGYGDNLLMFLCMGLSPENLIGIEIMEDRIAASAGRLPSSVTLLAEDASKSRIEDRSQDIVLLSTVFSSILDPNYQANLASRVWSWVRPGGGVLWYDFVYNNPSNPDVRGVGRKRLSCLFPEASIHAWRATLAPPVSRFVCKVDPRLYDILNVVPLLRTHLIAWLRKGR